MASTVAAETVDGLASIVEDYIRGAAPPAQLLVRLQAVRTELASAPSPFEPEKHQGAE